MLAGLHINMYAESSPVGDELRRRTRADERFVLVIYFGCDVRYTGLFFHRRPMSEREYCSVVAKQIDSKALKERRGATSASTGSTRRLIISYCFPPDDVDGSIGQRVTEVTDLEPRTASFAVVVGHGNPSSRSLSTLWLLRGPRSSHVAQRLPFKVFAGQP